MTCQDLYTCEQAIYLEIIYWFDMDWDNDWVPCENVCLNNDYYESQKENLTKERELDNY